MQTTHQNKRYWKLISRTAGILPVLVIAHLSITSAQAAQPCEQWSGKALSIQGKVEVSRADQGWDPVSNQEIFCPGDRLRVDKRSRAAILLSNQTLIRLAEESALTFVKQDEEERSWLDLLKGAVHFISRTPRSLNIKTPYVNAGIEGTEFAIRVEPAQTRIWVFEGQVSATNPQGSLMLASGEAAVAEKGGAPVRKLEVRPRDAVQWALYYPPVIDYREETYATGPDVSTLREALASYRKGDLPAAFARLDAVPTDSRTAQYYNLRAGLLLNVGLVDEARTDIDQAFATDPNDGTAYALQSVIAVTQNDNENALALAQKGTELSPKSPVPQIALSYAHQALFDIEKAKKSVEQAVNIAPQDALAWARLAELELSLGNLDSATAAARKAVEHDPNLARTQTVLGFANLTEIETDQAKTAFDSAIGFDPADPLPRLGLGLAKIRQGDLDEGTEQIETAAILDPDNALVRSYLGKAYYEQKRTGLARTEFAIAKELDPRDPTPWFYDAILKQTENRPVEALHYLQRSIELNDNRAVYRSRLLLDEDLAARSANLSRIYLDLGFGRRSLLEAWNSVNIQPSNYSSHRFLADSYLNVPRLRIATASELLQSQLLQPINITPVQPQLSGVNPEIVNSAGPTSLSANEYNPLFANNSVHFLANGTIGTNDTLGDNAIISTIYNKFSASFGQFHFETDAKTDRFPENNHLKRDAYIAFGQYAPDPKLAFQFEFRSEDISAGNVGSVINTPENDPLFTGLLETKRQRVEQDTARLGVHYEPSTAHDFILSSFYTSFSEKESSGLFSTEEIFTSQDGYQFEGQHLFHSSTIDTITGIGYSNLREKSSLNTPETRQLSGYIYLSPHLNSSLTAVLGLSFDSYKDKFITRHPFNPKFGFIWTPTKDISVRAAVFKTLKRSVVANQTIEPTQVTGFNQFFDDINGAISWRYGAGVDYKFSKSLLTGFETSWRDVSQTEVDLTTSKATKQDRDEVARTAYLYWTPSSHSAISLEYRYDGFHREFDVGKFDSLRPRSVLTHTFPFNVSFFDHRGLIFKLGGNYVNQRVKFVTETEDIPTEGTLFKESDEFWVFDSSIGYRLPRRLGSINFEVKNIFNTSFRFQSTFDAFGSQPSPYLPERQFFINARFSL